MNTDMSLENSLILSNTASLPRILLLQFLSFSLKFVQDKIPDHCELFKANYVAAALCYFVPKAVYNRWLEINVPQTLNISMLLLDSFLLDASVGRRVAAPATCFRSTRCDMRHLSAAA